MPTRLCLLLSLALLISSCGGGGKHLPSSNPPEYDPRKVYTTPAAPPSAPATMAKPAELERLQSQLQLLEAGQEQKSEGKNVPFDPKSLQLFKGVTNPCEALSKIAQGLGSAQFFSRNEGAALKKALGPEADGITRRMDEHMAEGLKHSLGAGAADCPISVRPRKSSGFIDRSQPARLVLTHTSATQPLLLTQTTMPDTSQDDYEVEKHSSRENAPPEWVGWRMMDTMTRIGKKPATEGIRELYEWSLPPRQ